MLIYASLLVLGVILGASHSKMGRSFLVRSKERILGAVVGGYALGLVVLSYRQFEAWKAGELTRLLLPPHQKWSYFFFYVGTRFWAPYVISFVVAILFLAAAHWANRKYHERFFEREEIYLAATCIFVVGYPGVLLYIPLVLVAYICAQLFSALRSEGLSRIPMYHLWVPLAMSVIIGMKWIVSVPVWSLWKI